jgi:hypothetical protein
MEKRVIVAGINANGEADLLDLKVDVTEAEFDDSEHYDKAREAAEEAGFEGPFVCFDEYEAQSIIRMGRKLDPKCETGSQTLGM